VKTLILAAVAAPVLLAAGCASAPDPAGQSASLGEEGSTRARGLDNDEVLCRRVEQVGTHLGRRRECKTLAEWREIDVGSQEFVRDSGVTTGGNTEEGLR
jgi:hypothetical protein